MKRVIFILLDAGDAFYEPSGPRILRFDNASATQEAIFIDFNLQQEGEPFIAFEKELTEVIDRRTLPTLELEGESVSRVDIYETEVPSGEAVSFKNSGVTLGIIAEGVVDLQVAGEAVKHMVAGQSFSLLATNTKVTFTNASSEVSAKVITFKLN